MTDFEIPANWKIPAKIKSKLPEIERETAAQDLWNKSKGLCFLCGEDLLRDSKGVQVDHDIPESLNGPTVLTNLNLTHRTCNNVKFRTFIGWYKST